MLRGFGFYYQELANIYTYDMSLEYFTKLLKTPNGRKKYIWESKNILILLHEVVFAIRCIIFSDC